MRCHRLIYRLTGIILGTLAADVYADIYMYVDENGVKHISNQPDDARYKLVMRTPKYKANATPTQVRASAVKPPQTASEEAGLVGSLQVGGDNWKIITPANAKNWSLEWSTDGGKVHGINEQNRKRLARVIARIAAQHRLDPHLLHAVISAESAFEPKAVSHKGAMGLMQLMPATAQRFGVKNPHDPIANMRGGARYLRWLLDYFKNDLNLALAGYNAGENAVVRHGYKIPPYRETQNYVSKVLRFYRHFRNRKL